MNHSVAAPALRQRLMAVPEEEFNALRERIETLAVSVSLMMRKAESSEYDLLTPREVAKRYVIDDKKVYAACADGRLPAENRVRPGGKDGWLINSSDAQLWYITFIRKKTNQ